MKKCKRCLIEKEENLFGLFKRSKDGLNRYCKICMNFFSKVYSDKNREKIRQKKRDKYKIESVSILKKENDRRKTDAWRKHHNEYQKKHRLSRDARQILRRAVSKGLISKNINCENCFSDVFIEAHHKDYSKPLEVVWLCRACHKSLHFTKGN